VPISGLPGVLLVLVSDEMVSLLLVLEVYHVVAVALLELTVCESPDVYEVAGEEVAGEEVELPDCCVVVPVLLVDGETAEEAEVEGVDKISEELVDSVIVGPDAVEEIDGPLVGPVIVEPEVDSVPVDPDGVEDDTETLLSEVVDESIPVVELEGLALEGEELAVEDNEEALVEDEAAPLEDDGEP
jgi:hypothetical protein